MAQGSDLLTGSDGFYTKVLNRNIGTLIEDLDPQPVLDTLLAEEFIPYTQVRDIQELRLTSEKNRKIVEFVITRGRDGYLNFKKCLIKSGQKHIADSLERAERALRMEAQMEQTKRASGVGIISRVPTDDDLMDIAQQIGNNWEFVGTRLGVSAPKIDQIKLDNHTTELRIHKLLLFWRDSQPNSNTLDKLLAVLRELKGRVTLDWEKIQGIANRKPNKSNKNIQRESPITRTPVERLTLTANDGNMTSDQRADVQTDEDHSLNSTAFKDPFGKIRMQDPNRTNINQPDISRSFPRGVDEENLNVMDGPPSHPGKHDYMDAGREDIGTRQRPTLALTEESIILFSGLKMSELSKIVHNRLINPSQMAEITEFIPVSTSRVMPVEPESIEAKRNDAGNLDASAFHFSPESAKAELSMSPHDGRLRTPSVECFKYVIGNKATRLGEGGYGIVYLLDDAIHDIGIPVVVKVIETKADNDNNKNSITNEKLASRIMDFSIVPLLAMTVDIPSGKSFFLSPYLENGDLGVKIKEDTDVIKNGKPNEVVLTENRRLVILNHVSSALDFLHRPMPGFRGGIIHMDLSTKNIVLDKMWNARLTDFGLSREFKEGCDNTLHTGSKMFGTPGYWQSANRQTLTAADDYYNFGVVIREILTGKPPTGENEMLKNMTPRAIKRNIQKEIWGKDSLTDILVNLSKKCLSKEENLAVKKDLSTLMEDSPRWTSNPGHHRCEKCMVNTAAKDCKKLLKHDFNCLNPIQVCAACMRNSYLNPIICHSCNKELVPYIGSGWGAILIAGNDTKKDLALGFKRDISKVMKIIVSKCPLVMGISENNVELITPDEPGVKENMMTKFVNAVENLKRKDVYTLLIYFTGHHYLDKGFMLGHDEEFLTVEVLQRKMKDISNYCSPEAVKEKSSLFSEKRFIVFLDCCESPDLIEHFNCSEKKCGTDKIKPYLNTNGNQPIEEDMQNQNYCILEMSTCRPLETSYGDRQGSAFTDLFCRCLTQRALQIPCKKKACDHSKLENDFIRFEDLHNYISQHGEKLNPLDPVMNVKGALSADLIVAYNVNFKVVLEFKIKNSCEKVEVLPEGFTDLQHLQQSVLKRIKDENKANLLFKGNADIETFADCTCFEVERGPKETVELDTLDVLMAAWNSKRDITISMRTAKNIDRGKVLVYTGEETNTIEAFISGSVVKTNSTTETNVVLLTHVDDWLKNKESTCLGMPVLADTLECMFQCKKVDKLVDDNEDAVLHVRFPKSAGQERAGTCMCLEVQFINQKF